MNMQLFNLLLPFLMLFTGVLNLIIGIDGLRRSKDPKEIEKKKEEKERQDIKMQWKHIVEQ